MNELDESRRWHELYGGTEDGDEGVVGTAGGGENGGVGEAVPVQGRRKKTARSRKRGGGPPAGVGDGGGVGTAAGAGAGAGVNGGGGEL